MKKLSSLCIKGISVLPALLIMPAMADDYYSWWHPENISSYSEINGDITNVVNGGSYDIITGTVMRNIVNGNVNLTLNGVTQTAKNNPRYSGYQETNVMGSVFVPSNGGYLYTAELGAVAPSEEARTTMPQFVNGDVNVVLNDSTTQNSVIGVNFYLANTEYADITELGLSGKTTVTVNNSTIGESVRGTNYRDITHNEPKAVVQDIELNINNSLVKEEIVSAGAHASAQNVVINVTGKSAIGYTDFDTDERALTRKNEEADGWIIAGANRSGATIASTVVNLNTDKDIKIAGDVNVGSRQRTDKFNTDENSVIGDATLNMFGGGTIDVGGNLRAYHVGGDTTININNAIVNISGNVPDEFETINMDENAVLNIDGKLSLTSDSNVNITLVDPDNHSKISVGELDANGANLNFTVAKKGVYNIIDANVTTSDFTWNPKNPLFEFTHNNGILTATTKSATDIANGAGLSADSGNTISALVQSNDDTANQISLKIQDALNNGDTDYVEGEIAKMNPAKAPVITSVALNLQNQVFSAAGERMSLALTGRNAGDIHADLGVWTKGTYNKTKHHKSFTGETFAGSVGFDTDLNHSVILGVGYSFGDTNVDLRTHDVDIDSHTLFVYGQYRNSDWFVNGTIAYTMSKYDWNKNVFGINNNPSYHVNSLSEQIMGGYHFDNGITPTLGLRYLDVHQDSYSDGITSVAATDSKYLTGVAGVDYKYTWIAPHTSVFWNPELHVAATYDMVSDSDTAIVMIPGAAAYAVDVDNLSRLGGEFGVGISAEYYYLTVSLNYDLNLHRDYQSHTGSLKVKYKF